MNQRELDEYLEALWYLSEEERPYGDNLQGYVDNIFTEHIVAELAQLGFVTVDADGQFEPTRQGYEQSRRIVRCHRLAERLLADVLGLKPGETEKGACEFEHNLVPEIADSICTLLGHPRECPHGLKIPEGECCRTACETFASAIVPLDRVKTGESVKVAYVHTPSNSRMHKLTHFGIIPGAAIRVHQRYPSFIIQCGNTQVAMEEDIAREIFVLYPGSAEEQPAGPEQRRRWRGGSAGGR